MIQKYQTMFSLNFCCFSTTLSLVIVNDFVSKIYLVFQINKYSPAEKFLSNPITLNNEFLLELSLQIELLYHFVRSLV